MDPTRNWLSEISGHLPSHARYSASHAARDSSGEANLPTAQLDAPKSPVLRKKIMTIMIDGCKIDGMAEALEAAGYEVQRVKGLPAGIENLSRAVPSLVIVGGPPAQDLLSALRQATKVPILALLTQASESDTLDTLSAGADDCQPASTGDREIVLRVRTLLRRSGR
jgi:DNA-binding response OmpR family regulator